MHIPAPNPNLLASESIPTDFSQSLSRLLQIRYLFIGKKHTTACQQSSSIHGQSAASMGLPVSLSLRSVPMA
jgi:hypothetical protein